MKTGASNNLSAANQNSAENTAIIYSLIETCKAQDVYPREWLTDDLKRVTAYNNNYNLDLADLLSHNWKKARGV